MALTEIGSRWAARFVLGAMVCSSTFVLAGPPKPCAPNCLPSDFSAPPQYHPSVVDPNCPPAPVEPAPVPKDDMPPSPVPTDENAAPMPSDLPPAPGDAARDQQVDDLFNNNAQAPAAPNLAQFQQNTSTTGGQGAFGSPNMIGDFFGSSAHSDFFIGITPYHLPGGNIAAAPGQNVGRMKLTENANPFPQDRAYINYSYFQNTPLAEGGVNVNRITPGIEKTFMDGNMSFELRTPFAKTLDSTYDDTFPINSDNAEFGNITMYLKALLWRDCNWAFSTGLGMAVPTADDFTYRDGGVTIARVENQSVHLLPFLGAGYTNDNLFFNTILQFDVDANGNEVYVANTAGGPLTKLGNGNDRSYAFLDLSLGYWIYRDKCKRGITGVAPIVEYHWNQSLNGGDDLAGTTPGGLTYNFGRPGSISVHNVVLGLTTEVNNNANLTLAYATPINNSDQQFDGEFRVMFNWYFGPGGCR